MFLKLYNFLSRKVEEFKPLSQVVGLYTCGPTVYDFVHIGNWRTFIFEDILKRVLMFNGYKVKHVMNITDIDDKIIKAASDQRIAYREITQKYEKAFFEDLEKLNIIRADVYPKATEHITTMIRIIVVLLDKGFAYKAKDGIYFSVEKFKDYGKLSGLSRRNLKKGARIDSDLYDKESWSDFALWKFPKAAKTGPVSDFPPAENEARLRRPVSAHSGEKSNRSTDDQVELRAVLTTNGQVGSPSVAATRNRTGLSEPSWEAPFGRGRPGWHIECSAMSQEYLGKTFDPSGKLRVDGELSRTIDIHCGGVDLLFPHHENEIAQSEAASGQKFVNFWVEGEHLLVEGEKMAKSLGNIFRLSDLAKRGFEPLALRYLFLTAHYRSKLNFTWKSLEAAGNALNRLRDEVATWDKPAIGCAGYENDFAQAINNDLDMPKALSIMWETVRSDYPSGARHQSILVMDKVLGLGLGKVEKSELPKGAKELIEKREEFRKSGKFEESDKIRQQLFKIGVEVEDTVKGPKWKVKKGSSR